MCTTSFNMNWARVAVRAAKLGVRKHGRYQFVTECFFYAAIPIDRYDTSSIVFDETKQLVIITTPELTIEIDGMRELHKVKYENGSSKTFQAIDDLINVVRLYYIRLEKVKFALN